MKRYVNCSMNEDEWSNLKDQLKADEEQYYNNPLDEYCTSGIQVVDIISEVDSECGIYEEPSVRGGRGTIFLEDSDGNEVGQVDYQEYNDDVLDMALECSDETSFRNRYKKYILELAGK